jgi:hypothetical protein
VGGQIAVHSRWRRSTKPLRAFRAASGRACVGQPAPFWNGHDPGDRLVFRQSARLGADRTCGLNGYDFGPPVLWVPERELCRPIAPDSWGNLATPGSFSLWDYVECGGAPSPLVGDVNCDGAFNGCDIDLLVLALTGPGDSAAEFPACDIMAGDANGDRLVNGYDVSPFLQLLVGR